MKKAAPALGLEAWVDALLDALVDGRGPVGVKRPPDALDDLAERFGLDEVERSILLVLGAIERAYPLQRKVGVVTVGHLRALLGSAGLTGVEARLAPGRPLRMRSLVHVVGVVGAPPRLVAASDVVRLEVGLVPRLLELPQGIGRCLPGPRLPSELANRLSSSTAQIVLHEVACTATLAQTLADGLGRVVIHGNARRLDVEHAARLRRDADLDGAVLWLSNVADDLLEPLLVPPPQHPFATPLLVLSGASAEPTVDAAWQLRREKITASIEAGAPSPRTELDYIRALAQRDAERAMGIVRVAPVAPPRQTISGRIVDASVRVAEDRPAQEPRAEAKNPAPTPAALEEAPPAPASTPAEEQPAPIAPASAAAPEQDELPEGPRLDVAADANLETRARAAMQSGSAQQRIELLESFAGVKHPAAIAAVRHNVTNEHPRLKAVAERLMSQLFGAAWNRSRAIPKPVQPPRTEE